MIAKYSAYPDRCIRGSAPTIHVVQQAYGVNIAHAWLMLQLEYINKLSGAQSKMNEQQVELIASSILANEEFSSLKVTDIMLFINQFLTGKYGHFYGAVDGQVIGDALYQYIRWKRQRLANLSREEARVKQQEQINQWRNDPNCISREEYDKLLNRKFKRNTKRRREYLFLAQKRHKFQLSNQK